MIRRSVFGKSGSFPDKSRQLLNILVGMMALFLIGCQSAESEPAADSEIDLATDFSLASLDDGQVTLSELRGEYVLVNFWATWCIPCRAEMPYLQEIFDKHDQLTVLAINMGEDPERVRPFIEEMGFTYPILLDPPDDLTYEHNVRGLPVSFVVGPDGEIVYRRVGEILPEEFDVWLAENLES